MACSRPALTQHHFSIFFYRWNAEAHPAVWTFCSVIYQTLEYSCPLQHQGSYLRLDLSCLNRWSRRGRSRRHSTAHPPYEKHYPNPSSIYPLAFFGKDSSWFALSTVFYSSVQVELSLGTCFDLSLPCRSFWFCPSFWICSPSVQSVHSASQMFQV